jgi:hypothetical protein
MTDKPPEDEPGADERFEQGVKNALRMPPKPHQPLKRPPPKPTSESLAKRR